MAKQPGRGSRTRRKNRKKLGSMADHKKIQRSNAKSHKGDKGQSRSITTRTPRNGKGMDQTLGGITRKDSSKHKAAARRRRKTAQQRSTNTTRRPERRSTRTTTTNTMA
eukprot:12882705-Prorocentrum_lima.AAC.1